MQRRLFAPHHMALKEGIRGFGMVKREYGRRAGDKPKGRKMLTRSAQMQRLEEILPLIADGTLPLDDTTAQIMKNALDPVEKMLKESQDA